MVRGGCLFSEGCEVSSYPPTVTNAPVSKRIELVRRRRVSEWGVWDG